MRMIVHAYLDTKYMLTKARRSILAKKRRKGKSTSRKGPTKNRLCKDAEISFNEGPSPCSSISNNNIKGSCLEEAWSDS